MKNLAPIDENKDVITKEYVDNGFQATLVSGTNIKTINNTSILGSGNIEIQGASGTPITNDEINYIILNYKN